MAEQDFGQVVSPGNTSFIPGQLSGWTTIQQLPKLFHKEFLTVFFCHLCFSSNGNRNNRYFCPIYWWKHFRVYLTDQTTMAASLPDSRLRLLISLKNTGTWQYMLEERKVNSSSEKKKIWQVYHLSMHFKYCRLFKT